MKQLLYELMQFWWAIWGLLRTSGRTSRTSDGVRTVLGVYVDSIADSPYAVVRRLTSIESVSIRLALCAAIAERQFPLYDSIAQHPNPFGRGACDPHQTIRKSLNHLWQFVREGTAQLDPVECENERSRISDEVDLVADGKVVVDPVNAWLICRTIECGWLTPQFQNDSRPLAVAMHCHLEYAAELESDSHKNSNEIIPKIAKIEERFLNNIVDQVSTLQNHDTDWQTWVSTLFQRSTEVP